MRVASVDEQEKLAEFASTSRQNLYQMASGNRAASSKMAIRIEKGAAELRKNNKNLPVLLRSDLNETCKGCDFARRCIGAERITISDFDYILDQEEQGNAQGA